MDGKLGDRNVLIREFVVLSNNERKIRGVSGAEVVDASVCTMTRSSRTVKTYGDGSRSATLRREGGVDAQVGLKMPASMVLLILAACDLV